MKRDDTSTVLTGWKSRALGSTALTALFMTAAHAASVMPPATGSLPGTFSSNAAGVTYTLPGASTTTATITTAGGVNVLQFGGTALTGNPKVTPPAGVTANTGFSIGGSATLNIAGTATSTLVNDLTGSPSQVFGTLNAGGLSGPLFVANASGVIVGATGVITAPPTGIGLVGYAVDSGAFGGSGAVTINNSTTGTGGVTITAGATLGSNPVLVASNGTVNIAATSSGANANTVLAGFGFSAGPASVAVTAITGALTGTSAVVNVTPANGGATLSIFQLWAGGAVNNSANLNLPPTAGVLNVQGLFTNTGVLNDNGNLNNNQLAGGLTNAGVINEASAGGVDIVSTKGNVQSTGALNLAAAGDLTIEGANVDLEGTVQIGGKALSSTNPLTEVFLSTLNGASAPQAGGVVDLAATLFSDDDATVEGRAIRIIGPPISLAGTTGSITDSDGAISLEPGNGAASVADPFYNLKALNYTLSVFPGTTISETAAGGSIDVNNPGGSTAFGNSPGLNLNGQLDADTITVFANNVNGGAGLAGGFSVANNGAINGTLNLTAFGNVNNPGGAAAAGSSAFQFNFIGVTVAANGGKAGTANINLAGPSFSSGADQNVNLLVSGNAELADGIGAASAPSLPTAVLPSYANNHLVVTATGNIGLFSNSGATTNFYWPGLVFLTSGATAANPVTPNATASISLGDAKGAVNLENLIPADLTKADVDGQIGHGGVWYMTNTLVLAPESPAGANANTTISNNSNVNFLNSTLATSFFTVSGANFSGGTITGSVVNKATLPAADFQP